MAIDPRFFTYGGQALEDLGAGLVSGGFKNMFGGALQTSIAREPYRQEQLQNKLALERDKDKVTKAAEALRKQGYGPLGDAVESGALDPASAWNEAFKRMSPGYGGAPQDPTETASGRQQLGQQYGLTGADLGTYVMTGKLPDGSTPNLTPDIQNYEYAQNHPGFGDYQSQRGGTAEVSLTPVWGTDAQGNPVLGQLSKSGQFVQTKLPDGVTAKDPVSMAGDKTGATVDAKTAATARAALPAAEQTFKIANDAATALLDDTKGMQEQFGNTLGFPNQKFPVAYPGSPMARFRTELAQGQGNAFLQARNVLKGSGQITDYEGAKAEAAYSRMQLAADNNNQQEFITAVQDFQQAVRDGYEKLKATANNGYAQGSPAVTGGGQNTTSSGVSWSVTP